MKTFSVLVHFHQHYLWHISKAEGHLFVSVQDSAAGPFSVMDITLFQTKDINPGTAARLRAEAHSRGYSGNQECILIQFNYDAGAERFC